MLKSPTSLDEPTIGGPGPADRRAKVELVETVLPMLDGGDPFELESWLRRSYRPGRLCRFLDDEQVEVRQVAAFGLSLIGSRACIRPLLATLHDEDEPAARMAERALWSIWCRSGTPSANRLLAQGSDALADEMLDRAAHLFTAAIGLSPRFGEAFNQRSIAYFLSGRFDDAADDCLRCVACEPAHFGAWAGLGHCRTALGDLAAAADAYRRALAIHPRLCCVRDALDESERPRPDHASPAFASDHGVGCDWSRLDRPI